MVIRTNKHPVQVLKSATCCKDAIVSFQVVAQGVMRLGRITGTDMTGQSFSEQQ
jgi:hypothetical protein